MRAVTLLRTITPASVGKSYHLDGAGELQKITAGHVTDAIGVTEYVPDAAAMKALLDRITSETNTVIVNGIFRGAGKGEFRFVTEKRFKEIVTADGGHFATVLEAGNLYKVKTGPLAGQLVGARKKELQEPSSWLLLDADYPKGFPEEWRGKSLQQRLELLEGIAPGISKAERVELRGSSARVVKAGQPPGASSHAWVLCDDAADVARAAVRLRILAVASGVSFQSPRYAKDGTVASHVALTAIDLAPWHPGRLNFDSKPTVSAPGYTVADAGTCVINPGGGLFSTGKIRTLNDADVRAFETNTGTKIKLTDGGETVEETGTLTWETQITRRGVTQTLRDWIDSEKTKGLLKPSGKLFRCETPFRASESENAYVGIEANGYFLFDNGTRIKYLIPYSHTRMFAGGEPNGPGGQSAGSKPDGGAQAADGHEARALLCGANGAPLPVLANVVTVLRGSPAWRDVVAFDRLADKVMLMAPIPETSGRKSNNFQPRPLLDSDVRKATVWFQQNGLTRIGKEAVADGLELVAQERSFDPLEDKLRSLKWDGVPRISRWLFDYCGVQITSTQPEAYLEAVARKWLIAAVARAFRPGCKVDTVLVLAGAQGLAKSTFGNTLAYDLWFSDALPAVHTKDASGHLCGRWIIELAEMAHASRADVEETKAFVSRSVERFRRPYDRLEIEYPRRCIFFGTSNRNTFLRDETGNRRFWPVDVSVIDIERLRADRDQLWAEAVHAFDAGEKWWFTPEEERLAVVQQKAFMVVDERALELEEKLGNRSRTTTLEGCDLLVMQKGIREQREVAAMLRHIGWQPSKDRRHRFWERTVTGDGCDGQPNAGRPPGRADANAFG
jgi:hypothetical protein